MAREFPRSVSHGELKDTGRTADALLSVREARQLCEVASWADKSDASATLFENLTRSWFLEGAIHNQDGRAAGAIAAFRGLSKILEERVARAPTPDVLDELAGNEYNLGTRLEEDGRVDEAMTAYRRSLDLRRQLVRDHADQPEYRLNVAFTLGNLTKCVLRTDLPAAEGYCREAVTTLADLAAKYPKSVAIRNGLLHNRFNLAVVLRERGDLDGAIAHLKENIRAHDDAQSKQELLRVERLRAILPRLADVASGKAAPAALLEAIDFARLCSKPFQQRFASAARIYGAAFAAESQAADDLTAQHRYLAARAAARAARGDGADPPPTRRHAPNCARRR